MPRLICAFFRFERAFHYFSIGGERGSNVAMKNLGIMHEDGRPGVVPKDKIISIEWYRRIYFENTLSTLFILHASPFK